MELMFTPRICAASRSMAVERIARPSRVRPMNSSSATIRISASTITNRLMSRIVSGPISIAGLGMTCGDVTSELLIPTNTRFWRMKLTPIAVIRGASRGALRNGR